MPTTDSETMAAWMEMPLVTAESVMRIAWPEQTPGCWNTATYPDPLTLIGDEHLWKTYYWEQPALDLIDVYQSPYKLVVLALVPWALSLEDMDDLVQCPQVSAKRLVYYCD
jgi:hypothetical protein